MISLAFYNMKGGVGKTTAAVNIAYLSAAEGNRTLLWDLDSQGAATFYLNTTIKNSIKPKKFLKAAKESDRLICPSAYENLDILPADFQMRHLDALLEDEKKGEKRIKKLFESFSTRYDYVFIDCPPSISFLSEALFRAVDCLVMPVIPTILSLNAFQQVSEYINSEKSSGAKLLPFFSMYDWRKKMHREVFDRGTGEGGIFLKTCIPDRSVIEQMGLHRAPLPVYSPDSPCIESFTGLWDEIRQVCCSNP